jgi:hypothetical protein
LIRQVVRKWQSWIGKREQQKRNGAYRANQWLNLAPGVEVSVAADSLAWLNTFTGNVFVGNQVAALIWLCASRGLSLAATAEEIATCFGIPRDRAEQDIRLFVERLQGEGIVLREGNDR